MLSTQVIVLVLLGLVIYLLLLGLFLLFSNRRG